MIKVKVDLKHYKEFAKDFEASCDNYKFILRGSFCLAIAGMLLAFESHPVIGLSIFIPCIIIGKLPFMSRFFKRETQYNAVSKLLDTLDENGLFYYVDEDVLTTNNTIIKGLNYEVIKGSHNQLMDSYKDGEYKLILEVCDVTSRD